MLRIFVGVTHRPWIDLLIALKPDEVNFWQPSGSSAFRALRPGDLFLFKLKAPGTPSRAGGVSAREPRPSVAGLGGVW